MWFFAYYKIVISFIIVLLSLSYCGVSQYNEWKALKQLTERNYIQQHKRIEKAKLKSKILVLKKQAKKGKFVEITDVKVWRDKEIKQGAYLWQE